MAIPVYSRIIFSGIDGGAAVSCNVDAKDVRKEIPMKTTISLPFEDGIDRRGFLKCMQWAGTGVIWSMSAGVPVSELLAADAQTNADFSFVQISDSHIGFNKPANPDVTGTLQAAIDKINGLPQEPDFVIHTGDLSHTSKAAEFDTLDQVLKSAKPKQFFFVPGEHDTSVDDGKMYLERYGKGSSGRGWHSFNHKDVHFVGLSNVAALEGLGKLGTE